MPRSTDKRRSYNAPMSHADYKHFLTIPTRWMDNDIYGHVNNVVYYSWFDTVINEYLIRAGGLDIHNAPIVGFCVDSGCTYKQSFSFPEPVHAGLRVTKLGNSSVRYEVGLFGEGDEQPRATGFFVHVFVDRASNRSVPIPSAIRQALQAIRA
nr:thioesterase family protein [Casimicrobium huifangae]